MLFGVPEPVKAFFRPPAAQAIQTDPTGLAGHGLGPAVSAAPPLLENPRRHGAGASRARRYDLPAPAQRLANALKTHACRFSLVAAGPCPFQELKHLSKAQRHAIEFADGASKTTPGGKLGIPLLVLPPRCKLVCGVWFQKFRPGYYGATIWMKARIASSRFVPERLSLHLLSSAAMPRIANLPFPAWQPRGGARRSRQGWPSLRPRCVLRRRQAIP